MDIDLLIAGKLVRGQGPAESVHDPATGRVIAEVPEASPEQVGAAHRSERVRRLVQESLTLELTQEPERAHYGDTGCGGQLRRIAVLTARGVQ